MTGSVTSSHDYRPHIDGLRAIAVMAVIFNHMDHRTVPSGYLGVDIFFVISGFVITLSLHNHHAADLKSFLAGFYARRFRRIVPALLACVGVTALAAWLLDPDPEISLKTGLTALIGVSNLYLLSISADYFAQTSALNFLTHTWSLGVEEQFYLLFPLLMWFTRQPRTGSRGMAVPLLLVLSAVSIALLFAIPGARGGAAYFLPFGRLWELAAGALMALAPLYAPRLVKTCATASVQMIAAAVLIGVLFLPVAPSAIWALAIVPPTMILVLAPPATWPFRALSLSPMRWLGRVSYSLYLWHWPVISISLMLFRPTPRVAAIQLVVTLLLATLTYYGIEQPLRAQRAPSVQRRLFMRLGWALLITALMIIALLSIANHKPLGTNMFGRLPPAFSEWPGSSSRHERDCVLDGKRPLSVEMALAQCTVSPSRAGLPTLWVMGDSHAGQLRGLLGALHERAGLGIHLVETPGIPFPLMQGMNNPLRENLFAQTQPKLKKGDIIILARLLFDREDYLRPVQDLDQWASAVEALAQKLQPLGVSVIVIGPVPMYRYPSIARCAPDRAGRTPCDEPRPLLAAADASVNQAFRRALTQNSNLFYFDSFSALCPSSRLTCTPIAQRVPLYRDRDHLNALGAASLSDAFLQFLRAHQLALTP